jgi:tetraacyldisaccharide 4'-kinase
MGGSGKTPLVSLLLDWAGERGVKAVVLSRGYKGRCGASPLAVHYNTPPEVCGDEALMLARVHPQTAVLVHPRRTKAARLAEAFLRPDLFILEDGMQHLALRRGADIALLRPQDLDADWNRVLPSGPWREGKSALKAATVFALKLDAGDEILSARALERLACLDRPVYPFRLRVKALRPLGAGSPVSGFCSADLRGKPYLLASGVGNPAGVESTAIRFMGLKPERHFIFADHHFFTETDAREIAAAASLSLPLLCTAKDAVKLEAFAGVFAGRAVLVMDSAPVFEPPLFSDLPFMDWWERTYARLASEL